MLSLRSLWPLLLVFFLGGTAWAGGWDDPLAGDPTVTVYGPNNYKSVDANWSATVAPDGCVYVGNSAVLRFDGRDWTTIPIRGTYAIRSLAADRDGRVWLGGVDELGYIADGATAPHFVSLRNRVPSGASIGAVWNVYLLGSRVLFVCEQRVLVWDGEKFEVRELPVPRRLFSFRYRNGVMISQPGGGLWFTDGITFRGITLDGAEKDEIGWARDSADGTTLFVTAHGLVRFDGQHAATIPENALGTFITRGLATMAVELPDGHACIATYRSGVAVIDRQNRLCRVLDRTSGLPGQDVVSVGPGGDHLLCIVGRRFVAFVDSALDISTFRSASGPAVANPRLVVQNKADEVCMLTDDALYHLASSSNGAHWESVSEWQFTDGIALDNGVFLFGGLRRLSAWTPTGGLTTLRLVNDVVRLTSLGPDHFLAAVGNSLQVGRTSPEGPVLDGGEISFPEAITDLLVRGGEIWAATGRGRIWVLDADRLAQLRQFEAGRDLPSNFTSPRFMCVGQQYLVRSAAGLYAMQGGTLVPAPGVSDAHVIASERYVRPETHDAWAAVADATSEAASLLHLIDQDGQISARAYPLKASASVGRPVFLQRDPSGALWIVGSAGVVRLDANALARLISDRPELAGAEYRTNHGQTSLSLNAPWTLPGEMQRLSLDFRVQGEPVVAPVPIQSRLLGLETSWETSTGKREFTWLPPGRYQFQVRLPGDLTATTLTTFDVARPWYLSFWFIGAAVVAIGLILWWIANLRLKQVAARNKALAHLVESQTNELTKAVAAKSVFIAQLGHEIRNPLNGVVGLVSSLRGLSLDERAADVTDRLASCATQLCSVVEDVLEFSLVEAGKVQLKRRRFHPLEPARSAIFVCEAAGSLRPTLRAENVAGIDRPRIGDPDRIRQILANYLENAAKYARGSAIEVSVRTKGEEHVIFCVSDAGAGIPAAELENLFERFSRGEDARRRGIPGTGLGLAACRAYATAMGGKVWAESELGRGSKFFLALDLPFATAQDEAPVQTGGRILEGWSVFAVDDHDYNLFVLSDILEKMGAVVRTAESATAGMRLFETALPDLVFVDIDLGTESGFTLAREIRKSQSSYRDVPIIATSAFEMDTVREECLKAGINAFISKPITAEKVHQAVRQIDNLNGASLLVIPSPAAHPKQSNIELLSGGDPEVRERVLASARRTLHESADAIAKAAQEDDFDHVRRHAHAITSAALAIDLSHVANLARETERSARQGNPEACKQNVTALLAALRDSGTTK